MCGCPQEGHRLCQVTPQPPTVFKATPVLKDPENSEVLGGSGNFWFLWKLHYVRWCFARADRWKDAWLKLTQVRGCFAEADKWEKAWFVEESINMTPMTVGGGSGIGSPCCALLVFADSALVLVCFTSHSWSSLVMTLWRVTCQRTCDIPVAFLPLPQNQDKWMRLLVSSGWNCCCWFLLVFF